MRRYALMTQSQASSASCSAVTEFHPLISFHPAIQRSMLSKHFYLYVKHLCIECGNTMYLKANSGRLISKTILNN